MTQPEKGGLGRGLGALLPKVVVAREPESMTLAADPAPEVDPGPGSDETPSAGRGGTPDLADASRPSGSSAGRSGEGLVRELEIGSIKPNPKQPRTVFEDQALDDLAASIREVGLLQPIVVRTTPEGTLELVAGERRLRASLRAGRSTIPALVQEADDERSLLAAFIENVQRVDLNPLEEAAGYRTLIDDLGVTHEEVARRVGKSRATVTNALRLLTLAPEVQRRVSEGALSAAHARTIAALADHDTQRSLAQRVVAEGLSVRATEQLVKELSERRPLTEHAVRTRAAHAARAAERPAGVLEAERVIADALATKVRIQHPARGRGRIVVEYAGLEDLARITAALMEPRAGSADAGQDSSRTGFREGH